MILRHEHDRQMLAPVDIQLVERRLRAKVRTSLPLRGGGIHDVFELRTDRDRFVLKLYEDRSVRLTADKCAKAELKGLLHCEAADLPAPRPIYCWNNAILMTYVPGVAISTRSLTRVSTAEIVEWIGRFHSPSQKTITSEQPALIRAVESYLSATLFENDDPVYRQFLRILMQARSGLSSTHVLLRGDPALHNWIMQKERIYGLDFELCSIGQPGLDLGWLSASILSRGLFSSTSESLAGAAIDYYQRNFRPACRADLTSGLLSGFLMLSRAASLKSQREFILDEGLKATERLSGEGTVE
jgi:aminoglycoside phosphotransferase (APT) family kinase protein